MVPIKLAPSWQGSLWNGTYFIWPFLWIAFWIAFMLVWWVQLIQLPGQKELHLAYDTVQHHSNQMTAVTKPPQFTVARRYIYQECVFRSFSLLKERASNWLREHFAFPCVGEVEELLPLSKQEVAMQCRCPTCSTSSHNSCTWLQLRACSLPVNRGRQRANSAMCKSS